MTQSQQMYRRGGDIVISVYKKGMEDYGGDCVYSKVKGSFNEMWSHNMRSVQGFFRLWIWKTLL